jgi:hypothetical protein
VPAEFGTCCAKLSRTDIRDVDAANASIEAPLMNVRRAIMFLSVRESVVRLGLCTRTRLTPL